jgi:hypothetical protein
MSVIIVLGGHRCGTSSIAGAIAQLGIPVALPGDDIGASPSNPRGHFEDATLVRLHQRMLERGGWRDPQPPIATATQLLMRYDGHLQRRASAAERWLVKDPRLCFLLPILVNRVQSLNFDLSVISVTRPLPAVAESLRRRHRMSLVAAQRIAWLYEGARRTQVAWLATLPSLPLLQLDYDEILADRNAAVSKLAQFLDVAPTAAATEFLDPDLRHHLQNLPIAASR